MLKKSTKQAQCPSGVKWEPLRRGAKRWVKDFTNAFYYKDFAKDLKYFTKDFTNDFVGRLF